MPDPDDDDASGFQVSPALAGAVALVVAGLAAVGVSGDLLTRAVRNQPAMMAATVSLAVLCAAGAVVVTLVRARRPGTAAVVGILACISAFAVMLGAASLDVRETPVVSASVVATDTGYDVTVTARASGLRSDDDMLVQLQALRSFPEDATDYLSPGNLEAACTASRLTADPNRFVTWPGPLLAWQQAGPDSRGEAETSVNVAIPRKRFAGLCAVAVYRTPRPRIGEGVLNRIQSWLRLPNGEEPSDSNAIIRLR